LLIKIEGGKPIFCASLLYLQNYISFLVGGGEKLPAARLAAAHAALFNNRTNKGV
jgi:hypothetical protein